MSATNLPLVEGDPNSQCDEGRPCYQDKSVPVQQGIFVHDIQTGKTLAVAKTVTDVDDLLFWNYSGKPPCTGGGHHGGESAEDDGEPARFRSSAFVAIATRGAGSSFNVAFKARTAALDGGDPVEGIYLQTWPGKGLSRQTLLDTTMSGRVVDAQAPEGSVITELGIEREGLRGGWLVINASMATPVAESSEAEEDDSLAGIYLTRVK